MQSKRGRAAATAPGRGPAGPAVRPRPGGSRRTAGRLAGAEVQAVDVAGLADHQHHAPRRIGGGLSGSGREYGDLAVQYRYRTSGRPPRGKRSFAIPITFQVKSRELVQLKVVETVRFGIVANPCRGLAPGPRRCPGLDSGGGLTLRGPSDGGVPLEIESEALIAGLPVPAVLVDPGGRVVVGQPGLGPALRDGAGRAPPCLGAPPARYPGRHRRGARAREPARGALPVPRRDPRSGLPGLGGAGRDARRALGAGGLRGCHAGRGGRPDAPRFRRQCQPRAEDAADRDAGLHRDPAGPPPATIRRRASGSSGSWSARRSG